MNVYLYGSNPRNRNRNSNKDILLYPHACSLFCDGLGAFGLMQIKWPGHAIKYGLSFQEGKNNGNNWRLILENKEYVHQLYSE
jgi:hypothetical protein